MQYARYADVVDRQTDLTLYDPDLSVAYEGSSQLVAMGLLRPLAAEPKSDFPPAQESPVSTEQRRMLRQVRGLIKARKSLERNAHADAMALLKQGLWSEAVTAFQAAIAESPEFSWSHHYLGDALGMLQRWQEAVAAYQRAIELNPHFAPSYFNLGEVRSRLEQWLEAADCYRHAIDLQPDLPTAARGLARALARQARQLERDAQQWYRRAHALDPADMAIYSEAVDLRPLDADLCLQFADALAARNERTKAIFFFQLALQVRPDDAAAHARLAAVLRQDGDLAGAIACCRQAVLRDANRAEYHLQLAAILAEQGDLEAAITACQRAVALQPGQPGWLKELGDLMARAGRVDEAGAAYAEAVSHGYRPY
ncbi:MAG TPA: tetratricopeptide repeat protein [Candidatus Acidoferrales bacterium]|nr:tetratricopeptide repeat protein [Candidatus Acidoferrales bacterium]